MLIYLNLGVFIEYNFWVPDFSLYTGWFGIRKDFCTFLLSACPFLKEYGNISYQLDSINTITPPDDQDISRDVYTTSVRAVMDQSTKLIMPVVTIETPD